MEYKQLLEQAYKDIKVSENCERFEIPKVKGLVSGKNTIITNIKEIASYLRRSVEHLSKFLQKELATSGKLEEDKLIFNTKLNSSRVNEKIEQYAKIFVTCLECKKPDTEIIYDKGVRFKHCLACGAKSPIKGNI